MNNKNSDRNKLPLTVLSIDLPWPKKELANLNTDQQKLPSQNVKKKERT